MGRQTGWVGDLRRIIATLLAGCAVSAVSAAESLDLARDGATEYAIVTADDATAVDRYAASELALYLGQMTGAEFAVLDAAQLPADALGLFVGLSAPALARLGESDPLAELADQEHVARTHGNNLFLYGKGIHGSLWAVLEFLETSLGWRWYSVFEHPVLPEHSVLTLEHFRRKRRFSFPLRIGRAPSVLRRGPDFYLQQAINNGFERNSRFKPRVNSPFISRYNPDLHFSHSLFRFLPPTPDSIRGGESFNWIERDNYFDTHPEYFSMSENGKRVPRQLCFSNPAMRAELTANILKSVAQVAEPAIISVCAEDSPGPFCHCEDCRALETQYQSPGGPLYDYLVDLCAMMAEKHPGSLVHTLAYRRAQTQIPPTLPEGGRLPANLVIDFAPIEDNYFADWTHPDERIQNTYAHLQAWGRIATHLWTWLYSNPYGTGCYLPVGNIERLITNLRLAHAAGVNGVYASQTPALYAGRAGFSELQDYLRKRLMQDINTDTDALIREFTDDFYGPAGDLMRVYLAELEQCRRAMDPLPPQVTFSSLTLDEITFPYLTTENIHRWQGYFERMEARLVDRPERERVNWANARRELDFATLWRWFALREAYPGHYPDHQSVVARIETADRQSALPGNPAEHPRIGQRISRQTSPLGGEFLRDLVAVIKGGGQSLPLPTVFDDVDPTRIRTFVPQRDHGSPTYVNDADAAYGYATVVDKPDLPFNFGFFQQAPESRHGARRTIDRDEIEPGRYRLYELGDVEITPDCRIWFSARSWATKVQLGQRLFEPGAANRWRAWASLKFDGPTHGGETETDLVLVDRVILLHLSGE